MGPYATITWILPFVDPVPHAAWGLPSRLYEPETLLTHVRDLLLPGGTLIGAVILTLVLNGMNLLQVNANWQPFVTGVIVLLGVGIDMWTRRRAEATA